MTLVSQYQQYFRMQQANSPELIREAQRIRYDVYCQEFGFENPEAHPDGLEKDQHDPYSCHCLLLHQPSGSFVGCVRLVLANPEEPDVPLPFEENCKNSLRNDKLNFDRLPRNSFGEISRLAIRKEFRRRRGESTSPHGFGGAGTLESQSLQSGRPSVPSDRRSSPQIVLGLYLAAAAVGLSNGLDSVFAMMDPRLARHLTFAGIKFDQVGDLVDYHGPRAAFQITREGLFRNLNPEVNALLEAISAELTPPDELLTQKVSAG